MVKTKNFHGEIKSYFNDMSTEDLEIFVKMKNLNVDTSIFNDSDSLKAAVQKAYFETKKGDDVMEEKVDSTIDEKSDDTGNIGNDVNEGKGETFSGETDSRIPKFTFLIAEKSKSISKLPCCCHLFEMFMIENGLVLSDMIFLIDIKSEAKLNGCEVLEIQKRIDIKLPNFVYHNSLHLITAKLAKLNDFLSRENISITESYDIIEILRIKLTGV